MNLAQEIASCRVGHSTPITDFVGSTRSSWRSPGEKWPTRTLAGNSIQTAFSEISPVKPAPIPSTDRIDAPLKERSGFEQSHEPEMPGRSIQIDDLRQIPGLARFIGASTDHIPKRPLCGRQESPISL